MHVSTYRVVDGRTLHPPINATVYLVTDPFGFEIWGAVKDIEVARQTCRAMDALHKVAKA